MTTGGANGKARFLEAGRDLLLAGGTSLLTDGLTIDRVAQLANVTTQTFHNAYPRRGSGVGGKAQFVDELLASIMGGSRWRRKADMDSEISRRTVEAGGDPRLSIRQMANWDYEQLRADPATHLRLLVGALCHDHDAALDAVRVEYSSISTATAGALTDEFRRWGASLRQPFTFQRLAVVVTALSEGLNLRAVLDADAVPDDLFGDAVVALLAAVADPEQAHSHVDDVIGALVDNAVGGFALGKSVELPDDPAQAVIDAAATEFSKRGYFNTSRAQIAVASGVPPAVIDRLYPTTADIVVAALRPAFEQLRSQTRNDVLLRPIDDVLRRYLGRLAELLCNERAMAEAMTLILSMERFQTPVSATELLQELNFPSLIVEPIHDGQRSGAIVDDIPAPAIATTLANNVLFQCLRDPAATPASIATMVDRLCLRGLLRIRGASTEVPNDRPERD